MMDSDLVSLWLTLKLAAVTTLVLIVLGTPLAWWLSQRSHSSEKKSVDFNIKSDHKGSINEYNARGSFIVPSGLQSAHSRATSVLKVDKKMSTASEGGTANITVP